MLHYIFFQMSDNMILLQSLLQILPEIEFTTNLFRLRKIHELVSLAEYFAFQYGEMAERPKALPC
jgi:hypothetical protein